MTKRRRSPAPRPVKSAADCNVLGDHLAPLGWSHIVHLTPARIDCSHLRIDRFFRHRFIRKLERAAQNPVRWVRGLERSPGGVLHIHALLSGTTNLDDAYVEAAWELGKAQARQYDPARRGAWYVVKSYVLPEAPWEHVEFSARRPPPLARLRDAA